jgi:hypothetical protein
VLPDLVLGHQVHALRRRGAERFLRHGPGVSAHPASSGPGLSVSRRPGDRLPGNAGRGGGGGCLPGGGGAAGFLCRPLSPAASLCPLLALDLGLATLPPAPPREGDL